MQQVLIAVNNFTDTHIERIEQASEGWAQVGRIDQAVDQAIYDDALNRYDIVVGWPRAESLPNSSIRFVQLCSVGYDPYLEVSLDKKKDFVLCNARGVMSVAVAEHVLAMMFALTRRLYLHNRDQQRHIWRRADEYRIVDGATMCIVGLGSIGLAIAERCRSLGMRVIVVARTGKEVVPASVSHIFAFDALGEALAEADHVVLSVPTTRQTRDLFDEAMFRRMKPGACFYNVGRGSLVVESDLVKVLQDGHLWGAGLDVFATEPLPIDHPFWDMRNVIVTPHTAGRYTQEYDRLCELFVDNLQRFHTDRSLRNIINLSHSD